MLFILIILSLVFISFGVAVFFWAIRSRQFKELEMQAYSILANDEYSVDVPDKELDVTNELD
jgi:cbb3-type cytochrome oxidase maturation protein